MKPYLWLGGTYALAFIRAALILKNVLSGEPALMALAFFDLIALSFGLANIRRAVLVDTSIGSLVVPVCYALGLYLIPKVGPLSPTGSYLALSGLGLSYTALFYLKSCFSVGGSAWVRLVDRGPYKFIRHPQSLARLLMVGSLFFGENCGVIEGLRILGAVLLALIVVATEEEMLSGVEEWREYARRVQWRLIPGVL